MYDVKVEVVNSPVLELLFADWLNAFLVVEGVPKLGDEEKVLPLDNTLFYGTGNTLAGLDFVSIIYSRISNKLQELSRERRRSRDTAYRMHHRRDGSQT